MSYAQWLACMMEKTQVTLIAWMRDAVLQKLLHASKLNVFI